MEFQGFSPETIDFLWGIRFNNNREWFEAHKKQYQMTLYEPMKVLGRDLFSEVQPDFPELECKVSRIYRDARMHPPTPYKESIWICFRTSDAPWGEQPVFFFELTSEDYSYGFLFWFPRTAQMEQFRHLLAENPRPFTSIVDELERTTDLRLDGNTYRRTKPCSDKALERYFALKNFGVVESRLIDERLYSPQLIKDICACYASLKPLMRYCRNTLL